MSSIGQCKLQIVTRRQSSNLESSFRWLEIEATLFVCKYQPRIYNTLHPETHSTCLLHTLQLSQSSSSPSSHPPAPVPLAGSILLCLHRATTMSVTPLKPLVLDLPDCDLPNSPTAQRAPIEPNICCFLLPHLAYLDSNRFGHTVARPS